MNEDEEERTVTAVTYRRVSSRPDPRGEDRQTLENQNAKILRWVEYKKYNLLNSDFEHDPYADQESGRKADRPGLRALLEDARNHRFEVVIAVRLDRLGRNLKDLLNIANVLEENRIGLELLDSNILIDREWKNPAGNMMFNILGAVAQFEDELISERIKDAVERVRNSNEERTKRGSLPLMWGRLPYGFRKNTDPSRAGEPDLVPEELMVAKKVLRYKDLGMGYGEIAAKLGLDKNTVRTITEVPKDPNGPIRGIKLYKLAIKILESQNSK